jgi:hygromycin-B 7''-O-kinase
VISGKTLEQLNTLDGYRQSFMDASLWQPYIQIICSRYSQTPCRVIRPGFPGTYPTFIVDNRWVVKLFGRLFAGALAFDTEKQVNGILAQDSAIPAPKIIACGTLFEGSDTWPWPYLIYEYIPGINISEIYNQVSFEDKLKLAQYLGEITRRLHALPLANVPLFQSGWDAYINLLEVQRRQCKQTHQAWNTLPAHLIEQIDSYLLPVDALVDCSAEPHLIHADITRDHILGRLDRGMWITLGIIDFGDAMVGDLFYELVALHLDLFCGDKRLLGAYLNAYGLDEYSSQTLSIKAMNLTLLHRFNVLVEVLDGSHIQLSDIATLDQLAALLWDGAGKK